MYDRIIPKFEILDKVTLTLNERIRLDNIIINLSVQMLILTDFSS